jgi:hypothetical protein
MPGTMIARGNILYHYLIGPSLTPVAVAGSTAAEQSFTVSGLAVGDYVNGNLSSGVQTAGLGIVNMRVPSANTLTIQFSNSTAGSLTPVAGTYTINICRPESVQNIPTNAS